MKLNKEQALNYIKETKDFWKVTDFQSEILDFNPCEPHVPADLNFYIGHPEGSVDYRGHRGLSVGDVLPYTVLPKLLKETYADCKVFIPEWFNDIFQNNLYVDGNHSHDYKWGSMGTFGTTVQRCANVWGLKSNKYAPKLYPSSHIKKRENTILFTINSKTGGRVTNVDLFEEIIEHLSKQYTCVQLGLSDDYMVKSASQNILNVSRNKLVDFVAEFPIYIGAQSSIYHIAKGLGLKVVGILPDIQKLGDDGDEAPIYAGIGAEAIMLPLLTTTAPLEVEPCDEKYWNRAKLLNPFFPNLPPYSEWPAVWPEWNDPILLNHNISHIGWLYPDTPHLTVGNEGTSRCPTLSVDTIDKALNGEIYPFNDDRLWDYYTHSDLWTNTDEYINDGDNIKNKKYVDSIDLYDLQANKESTISLTEDRWVLGVNIGHDCGATLVKNGKVYVSIQQERVSRIKHDEGKDTWPSLAMDYCLDYAGIEKDDLERIVWNGIGLPYSFQVDVNGMWVNDLRNLGYDLPDDKLNYCTHHLAHAYSAHYSSGFEESVVVVVDAGGEINYKDIIMEFVDNKIEHIKRLPMNNSVEASSIYEVKKGVFNKIYSNYKPTPEEPSGMWWPRLGQSIGEFYSIGCNRMGMTWLDAGKLMGMAPYGREEIASTKFPTESVIYIDSDPKYGDYLIRCTPTLESDNAMPFVTEWDPDIFDEFPGAFWDNPAGLETGQFQDKADWAWWIQNQFEQIILFLAKKASMNSDVKNLCGAGGCFLNSVGNQKIVDLDLFENHFYVPAADDGGISLGCAFYGYYNFDKDIGKVNLSNKEEEVFMGREYDDDEILEDIEKYSDDITFTKIKDEEELSKKVARLISTGKVVGWFQGGSEMGPRALGHRSILADATDPDMKDIINERIKHREWYRPFAPACIKEDAHKYFTHSTESPYMLLIAQVKEEYKDKLPSITHVDGTARLQTVNRETNRRYYDVIKEFGIISGISVILNTSFNEAGEPIVETPENAIKCFLKNNIDYLVIENYFIERKNLDTKKLRRLVPKNKENKV
jgi:carbamoyltransferase